jgi:FG-GAP-like repeat
MTSASGTSAMQGIKTGIAIVDINQDGWPDIYQCRSSRSPSEQGNLLFINNKDMTFTESAADYGLSTGCSSNTANFFDFDLDGDLDMYLVNHPEDFTQVSNVRVTKVGNTFKHTKWTMSSFQTACTETMETVNSPISVSRQVFKNKRLGSVLSSWISIRTAIQIFTFVMTISSPIIFLLITETALLPTTSMTTCAIPVTFRWEQMLLI